MRRIAILLFLLLLPVSASAEIIDQIVARVNKDVITLYDVRQSAVPYLLQLGRNPAILDDPTQKAAILKEVLDDLVDRKLLVQEAAKLELKVTDKELDQWLAFTMKQRKMTPDQFQKTIEGFGVRFEVYRGMVRENLLRVRMVKIKIGSQVSVSQQDVDAAYSERFGVDGGKERYITVSHILIQPLSDSPDAEKVAKNKASVALQRVNGGEAFEKVAQEMSDGPTAAKGGSLGTFRRGDLDPDFEATAFKLKVNEHSKVVRTKFGFHVIRVVGVELRDAPDIEQRKDRLQMELQQGAMEKLLKSYMKNLRSRSFVEVRYK